MKKVVVFGTGDFADIIVDLVESALGREVAGYVLDDEYYSAPEYNGKPVVPLSKAVMSFNPEQHSAVIGIIGKDMYRSRERVFNAIDEMGYELENIIHPSAIITSKDMGRGNIIFEGCVLAYAAKLGDGNIMWPLSALNHHGKAGSFNNFAPGAATAGGAVIGNHCFLGVNSAVNNRITIADYTLAGAGVYIAKSTEEYGVYVPERSVKLNRSSLDMGI